MRANMGMGKRLRRLEVIFKVSERCNLACTYCYFFFKAYREYETKPAVVRAGLVDDLCAFIEDGVRDLGVEEVSIFLHGGEPLLLHRERFAQICGELRRRLDPLVKLTLGIQTNGLLLDDRWLEVFNAYCVGIGISIDGRAESHDRYRLDKKGRGTHARLEAKLRWLEERRRAGAIPEYGAICVIDPAGSARDDLRYMACDLGIKRLRFRLPQDRLDGADPAVADGYGRYLAELLQSWLELADPTVDIDVISVPMLYFRRDDGASRHTRSIFSLTRDDLLTEYALLTVHSDGGLSLDDQYQLSPRDFDGASITSVSLAAFLAHPLTAYIRNAEYSIPDDCAECPWGALCLGGTRLGNPVTRFDARSGMNHKSFLCATFAHYFSSIAVTLMRGGMPVEALQKRLEGPLPSLPAWPKRPM